MHRPSTRRLLGILALLALAALAVPASTQAQITGLIQGTVVDAKNAPVDEATITIELQEGITRKFTTRSNKQGKFTQIGLPSGLYRVSAEKSGVGFQSFDVRVQGGQTAEVKFQLVPGQGGGRAGEDPEKAAAMKAAFDAGVAASKAGQQDEAIAKFREALEILPRCYQCYYNMGVAYAQKKDFERSEEAFKKALDIKPDYADAYSGLANIYNAQRKFDQAQAMSAEAAKYSGGVAATVSGTTQADALFSQAIILWNASKIPEAKAQFREVIKLNPSHAEAHYWLGMAYVNEGKLPDAAVEFETYLKLAPRGQYADQAKAILSQVKK